MTALLGWLCSGLVALLGGCAANVAPSAEPDAGHPLYHRIWDVRGEQFVDADALMDAAAQSRHLLLGEIHINPEHHQIQAAIIEGLKERGKSVSLVFEIFEQDTQDAIDRALSEPDTTTSAVAAATGIEDSGWNWDDYEPLVGLALDNAMPLRAGNAPKDETMQVARKGLAVIGDDRLTRLALSAPLPSSANEALDNTIVASHCGHVFGDMVETLKGAQRLRDATMADVMLRARTSSIVLITGAGHARRDYGVPLYILRRDPQASVLAIGLTEIKAGSTSPAEYLDQLHGLDVPFDYLWFTSRTITDDPCEQFRDSLKKFGGKKEDTAVRASDPADTPAPEPDR